MRAVCEKRPRYFIWENVKGALSSQNGWDFGAVINEMAEAGYSLWWQVLNAKDFGVPQNRERIFVVGFRDRSAPEVFFEREGSGVSAKQDEQRNAYCLQAGNDKHRGTYVERDILQGVSDEMTAIRKLTPIECERLMGLPDNWTRYGVKELSEFNCASRVCLEDIEISDTQRYKMCGNGVVVNVVCEIIYKLLLEVK